MRSDKQWPIPTAELTIATWLPPRPGIRRACPKCGILHTERRDLLECLAESAHNA